MAYQDFLKKRGLDGVGTNERITVPRSTPAPSVAPTTTHAVTPTVSTKKVTPVAPVAPSVKQGPRKLFQGNIMDKAFDVLRLPEYAATGYLKGAMDYAKSKGVEKQAPITNLPEFAKSMIAGVKNIPSAVMNRQEIGREEGQYNIGKDFGVQNELAQTGINLATSLAMPSLPVGKIVKSIPGVNKLMAKGGEIVTKGVDKLRKIEPIAKQVEKLDPFFRNPELGKMVQEAEEKIATRQSNLVNQVLSEADKLTPAEQARIGQMLEGGISADPNSRLAKIAEPLRAMTEQVGKEAVDLGLISPETWSQMKGKYMTHIWNNMAKEGDKLTFAKGIIPKGGEQFFKQRKGAEGYIKEFTPAMIKGLGTEIKAIEQAKLYKDIASKFGQKTGEYLESGRAFAPASIAGTKAGKVLRGIDLPKEVADIMSATMTPTKKSLIEKGYDLWKKGKTIYNIPGYHVRNLVSNQILSDMSTEQGIPKTLFNYGKAVSQYAGKGDQSFVEAAKKSGLIGRKNIGAGFQEAMDVAGYGSKKGLLSRADQALTGFQNASEETSKLNVFTAWMNKLAKDAGKSVQDALKDETIVKAAKDKAEEAIFSPYRISKTERGLASKVVPFYSFARQAIPFTAKTALNRPGTLTKYEKAKTAIEGLSPERTGEKIPEYAKGQIRTPFKDKEGRSYYVNPKYILPWGSMEDVGGDISKGQLPGGLSLSPMFTLPAEAIMNKQLYTGKPITSSYSPAQQKKDYAAWAARSIGPTALSTAEKLSKAVTGGEDYYGRKRNIPAALLDALGIKTSAFSPEDQARFENIDKKQIITGIRKEINSLRRNQSIPEKERARRINELLQIQRETLRK